MKSKFKLSWLRSKQPRKQRKYVYNAPLHKRRKLVAVHLSAELREKHNKRSVPIRKGDRVKILRGQYKGTIGEVEKVDLKKLRLHVKGAEHKKKEGRASYYPIHPSNTIILTLKLDDTKRKHALSRGHANRVSLEKRKEAISKKEEKK